IPAGIAGLACGVTTALSETALFERMTAWLTGASARAVPRTKTTSGKRFTVSSFRPDRPVRSTAHMTAPRLRDGFGPVATRQPGQLASLRGGESSVEFRILGPLEIEGVAGEIQLGSGKQRALLALLLLHANDVVPAGRLIELL